MARRESYASRRGRHLNGAPFQYSDSLQNQSIRLLDLKFGSSEETVQFDIRTYELNNHPPYIALSYTWGDPKDTVPVLCDGRIVQVTRNLKDALWQLREDRGRLVRQKFRALGGGRNLRFWIDAICINQLDTPEKTIQVGLMAKIYQQACYVVAWLGPADESSDSVVNRLNEIGGRAEACGMVHGHDLFREIWQDMAFAPMTNRQVGPPTIDLLMLDGSILTVSRKALQSLFDSISGWASQNNLLPIAGIKKFFTRPWWGRIWVLQEVTFSKDTDFVCGTRKISRARCSAFVNAYRALWEVLTIRLMRGPGSLSPYQLELAGNLFHHRPSTMLSMPRIHQQCKFPLAALLRATCVGRVNPDQYEPQHLESTKPEDKIFALLNLAADQKELAALGVCPNYQNSYEQTYTITMAALLQQGHISLLSLCQPSRSPSLPSWAPAWSKSVTHMLQDVENDHMTLYPKFNASGSQTVRPAVDTLSCHGAILGISVKGFIYDKIHQTGVFKNRADSKKVPLLETNSWPTEWLLEIIRLTYCTKNKYDKFSDRLRASARTSIGDVGWNEQGQFARVGDARFADATVLLKEGVHLITNKRFKGEAEDFLAHQTIRGTIDSKNGSEIRLKPEVLGKSLGRLPFVTEKGHLVLSSEHVRQGDVVAVVIGSQVPFVLRSQHNGKYSVVGEAYVDGIMDGDAMEHSDWGSITLI